jgi:hypothetical protein
MNQPFGSAAKGKCSLSASPAFAYFAKVLARFSENNFFAVSATKGVLVDPANKKNAGFATLGTRVTVLCAKRDERSRLVRNST